MPNANQVREFVVYGGLGNLTGRRGGKVQSANEGRTRGVFRGSAEEKRLIEWVQPGIISSPVSRRGKMMIIIIEGRRSWTGLHSKPSFRGASRRRRTNRIFLYVVNEWVTGAPCKIAWLMCRRQNSTWSSSCCSNIRGLTKWTEWLVWTETERNWMRVHVD